jgi:hypothetical protein
VINYCLSIILLLCILTIYFNLHLLYGESPAFVRQEVDDGNSDLYNSSDIILSYRELVSCTYSPSVPSVDIRGISYMSDSKFLNATVWLKNPFQSFINSDVISSENPSSPIRPNIIYHVAIINSSSNLSNVIKPLIENLRDVEQIDSIEFIPMKSGKGENFKIMFNIHGLDTKYIWFFTHQNNITYFHSFEIHNYAKFYKKYLPIINKIINSTEFIQYSNTTYANYETHILELNYNIQLIGI